MHPIKSFGIFISCVWTLWTFLGGTAAATAAAAAAAATAGFCCCCGGGGGGVWLCNRVALIEKKIIKNY